MNAQRALDRRLVFAAAGRDDEVGPDHPFRSVLGQLARLPSTQRIDVPPLTVDAVLVYAQAGHGRRSTLWKSTEATACFATALESTPKLQGRVRARYRVDGDTATYEGLDGSAPEGAEAFATCLAPHLGDPHGEPHALEVVIELYPALTG